MNFLCTLGIMRSNPPLNRQAAKFLIQHQMDKYSYTGHQILIKTDNSASSTDIKDGLLYTS